VHRCPPKSLNVKQELLNYHNTVLFWHKILGGQSSPKIFLKREIQGGKSPPKLLPGWAHAYPDHPVPAPMDGCNHEGDGGCGGGRLYLVDR